MTYNIQSEGCFNGQSRHEKVLVHAFTVFDARRKAKRASTEREDHRPLLHQPRGHVGRSGEEADERARYKIQPRIQRIQVRRLLPKLTRLNKTDKILLNTEMLQFFYVVDGIRTYRLNQSIKEPLANIVEN